MASSSSIAFHLASASISAALILLRCSYKLFFRCKGHATCHRRWHVDDTYMAFALLPLAGRTSCILSSFSMNPEQTSNFATPEEAARQNLSAEALDQNRIISNKLLLPARIFYALL